MGLAEDLLEQARFLADREPRRPRQASLRRAVSAAYYALFHLLVDEAATRLSPREPETLRNLVHRAFAHADMKAACKLFLRRDLPAHLAIMIVPPVALDLIVVAQSFVDLQEARHVADYDVSATLLRAEVRELLGDAELSFQAWARIRGTPNANVFLAAMLLDKKWAK